MYFDFPIADLDCEPDMHPLSQYMSELSEKYYCATWLSRTEYILWNMTIGASRKWGTGTVEQEEIDHLKLLSKKYGCWIVWTRFGCVPTSLESWRKHLDEIEARKIKG